LIPAQVRTSESNGTRSNHATRAENLYQRV